MEAFTYIAKEWEFIFGDGRFSRLEYFKILSKFNRIFPLKEFIPQNLIRESFHSLSNDLVHVIRENPKEAYEYLKVLKQFQKFYPNQEGMKSKVFDESIHRMSKEMDFDFRGSSESALVYLELLLISGQDYLKGNREGHIVERVIDSFRKREREHESNVVLKAAILLIQYNAPTHLIEYLLESHPKFRNLFSKSPELARDILEATLELSDNERLN